MFLFLTVHFDFTGVDCQSSLTLFCTFLSFFLSFICKLFVKMYILGRLLLYAIGGMLK